MVDQFADSERTDPNRDHLRIPVKTVRQKLIELRAYCKDGVLYDGEGKPIVFFRIIEYGFPPGPKEMETLQRQEEEIRKYTQEGYTVVRMWRIEVPK